MEAISFPLITTTISEMASPQHFLKLEDLHTAHSRSASLDNNADPNSLQTSPPPVVIHSKPAKKRKSWGQVLPEPKTALPPRKRAKTEDEKEQRRIERIKRNRAAAHNSRERKRQETEVLAVRCARLQAELDAYRQLHGPLPPSVVLPEVTISNEDIPTPPPSLIQSSVTPEPQPVPSTPATIDLTTIKEEPVDFDDSVPILPPPFDNLDAKSSTLPLLDQTQHSAAMLCDLQCRLTNSSSTTSASPSTRGWTALFLHLITLQLQTCYKTLLLAIWSLSPSRMARLIQASQTRLTFRSKTLSATTPRLLRSMAMAQLNAATGRPTLRQGAIAALQRSFVDEVLRARVRAAAVRRRQIVFQQRKAFWESRREKWDDGDGDENGGA